MQQPVHMMILSLLLLLLFFVSSTAEPPPPPPDSLASDIAALLAFKNSTDPFNVHLSSWSPSTSPCCSLWLGVSCSPHPPLRIARLVIENLSLVSSPDSLPLLSPLSSLRVLSLKSNRLSGPLPGSLPASLRLLFLSRNNLSGPLTASISSLPRLLRLDLSHNRLSGPLPSHLTNLSRLLTLRLDSNNLTGSVSGLSFPNLQDLNLSSNSLSGAIPPSLAAFPVSAFVNNPGLCGPPLPSSCKNAVSDPSQPTATPPVPPASAVVSSMPGAPPGGEADRRRAPGGGMSRAAVIAIVVGDFALLLLVSGLLFCYFWRKFAGRNSFESEKIVYSSSPYATAATAAMAAGGNGVGAGGGFERGKMVFFEGTKRFELEDLLRASAEMLGKGGYGTAYKAVLGVGNVLAVKRLREAADGGSGLTTRREFEAQMELIGQLRHPNLVALKAYYHARDEKLLVFEYMAGGSLFSLLHGNRGPGRTPLDWTSRMRIAAGAARGVAYIHHHHSSSSTTKYSSGPKLCHGNIKSTNILLDKSLTPKLADFALSPLFPAPHPRHGHGGYRAPESAVDPRRAMSQQADIYTFGVVLLEMLTGKAVTDDTSLPHWVQSVVREEWTSEVFDLELMRYKGVEEEMVALLQVAMACVAASPEQRPKIGQVLKMIEDIRGGDGSPAYESFGETESSPGVSDETGTIVSQ